jgi:hypothetical protein
LLGKTAVFCGELRQLSEVYATTNCKRFSFYLRFFARLVSFVRLSTTEKDTDSLCGSSMLTASLKALGRLSGGDAVFLFDNVLGIGIIAANLSNGAFRLASEQTRHASQRCAPGRVLYFTIPALIES